MVSFLSNLWLGTVFQRRVHENKVVTIYIALPSGHFDAGFASVLVCNQARALLLGSGSWVCHPLICGVIPPSCTIAAYGAVILWCCDSMSAPRYAAVPCLGTRGVQRACCKLQQMLQTASWRTFFQPLRGSDLQSLNKVEVPYLHVKHTSSFWAAHTRHALDGRVHALNGCSSRNPTSVIRSSVCTQVESGVLQNPRRIRAVEEASRKSCFGEQCRMWVVFFSGMLKQFVSHAAWGRCFLVQIYGCMWNNSSHIIGSCGTL